MSRQPGQDYPDILLERYLAGDLADELRAEIERACERSEILRRRLDELSQERSAFLAGDPPAQFAHRLAAELHSDSAPLRPRRRWLAWLLAPSAAAAAATVLVTVVVLRTGPEQSRLNGVAMAPSVAATPTTPALAEADPVEESSLDEIVGGEELDKAPKTAYAPRSVVREPMRTAPAKPTATAARKTRKPKKRRRSGGGGGGGRSMDDLLDAPAPPPRPKGKSELAPTTESFMAAPADRSVSRVNLVKSDIMAGVKQGVAKVMPCIKRARQAGELAPGRHSFVLDWTIEPSGKVSSPKLVGPPNVLGTSLPACFARAMRKWRFPASAKGAPVRNFPFGPFSIK